MKKLLTVFVFALIITSCKKEKKEEVTTVIEETKEVVKTPKKIKFALQSKSNSKVTGNVVFTEVGNQVKMTAIVDGLAPGSHAIHIHQKADCSSSDGKSTGGHWNPTGKPHGKWGDPNGYHKGDIGNMTANEKGQAVKTIMTDEWCIGCGDTTKDIVGKAIIVHQGVDDMKSQPSGAAGSRVSCGGIIQ